MNSISNKIHRSSVRLQNIFRDLFITENDSKLAYWILAIITLCALVLRILVIDNPIGYDEAYTFIYFASRPLKYVLADYHAPNNHILNSLLIWVAYRILGNHTWIVRVPAFVASVLGVPVAYFMARRFFTVHQALAISAVLAIYPSLIRDSANGRGYMMIILFSFVLANIAGILVAKQDRKTLIAYAVTGALGFYTIPIFLYPMAGISLWVVVTYLTANEAWQKRFSRLGLFLGACVVSGVLTLILYSPVIIFGTGLNSIINNDIVTPHTWYYFTESLIPKTLKTWADWQTDLSPAIQYLLSGGFLISLSFYRKVSNQKLPLQFFLFLAIAILLPIQRVAPQPRIWTYLEVFYVAFSVAGILWFIEALFNIVITKTLSDKTLPIIILLFAITVFSATLAVTQSASAIADRTQPPEYFAANYLASHLQPDDTILSIAPVDIRVAYYSKIDGVAYDSFYQRDHPAQFNNALVVLRTDEQLNTPNQVIDFFKLLPKLNPAAAKLIYTYGVLQVYAVPISQP